VEAFIRVMNEPDDPAETHQQNAYGSGTRQYSLMLQSNRGHEQRTPGTFTRMHIPQSLVEAKMLVKSRLSQLAIQHGGEIWAKAATVIPDLAVATPEQWREAMEFYQSNQNQNRASWWDFMKEHPANPLGVELLVEQGEYSNGTPEQLDALLKTDPPLRLQMML